MLLNCNILTERDLSLTAPCHEKFTNHGGTVSHDAMVLATRTYHTAFTLIHGWETLAA